MSNIPGNFENWNKRRCAVITAHPDDETLWAGGLILSHPDAWWTIVTLCRKDDPDRSPKFARALKILNAHGSMSDIDDSPHLPPQDISSVQEKILSLLDLNDYDLILTHGMSGEYTRHLRHEEVALAVHGLWQKNILHAAELWQFAYEDNYGKCFPFAADDADITINLPKNIWRKKYEIITKVYGFAPDSFEAQTTPRNEAFRKAIKHEDIFFSNWEKIA